MKKITPNEYDTASNRLFLSGEMHTVILDSPNFNLDQAKDLYTALAAQLHGISERVKHLDLDLEDTERVATRLKEVFDNNIRPLERMVSGTGGLFIRITAARYIAAADTELKLLKFTLDQVEALEDVT